MCPKCIYKNICKLVDYEMSKNACDTTCNHFKQIPAYNADQNESCYLV